MTIYALIAFNAYAVAGLCLLFYRKQGARHRRTVSWLAWALLVVLAGSAIEIAVQAHAIGFFEASRAALLSLFIFVARGNVANLLRSNRNDDKIW